METVYLVISKYEWICPLCNIVHKINEQKEIVECINCGHKYKTEFDNTIIS